MAFLKTKAAPAELRVPSLSEAHAEYGLQQRRIDELNERLRALREEETTLIGVIASDTAPALKANVAALLGEVPSQKTENQRRLAEVRSLQGDVGEAIAITTRRRFELETPAAVAVFNAVKPEIDKRMAALLQALDAIGDASRAVDKVVDAIEREGAETSLLSPLRTGALNEQIGNFIRGAKEAGYGN